LGIEPPPEPTPQPSAEGNATEYRAQGEHFDPVTRQPEPAPARKQPPSWFEALLRGPRFIITTVAVVLVGMIVPIGWNFIGNQIGEPIAVRVEADPEGVGDLSWALTNVIRPRGLGPPVDLNHLQSRGIKVRENSHKVIVTGQRSYPILVTGMRARVLGQAPAARGTLVSLRMQGGTEKSVRVGFDLDASHPVAREDNYGRLGRPYFSSHHVSLANGESAVFEVMAYARTASFDWEILLELLVDGQREQRVVRPDDGPFRLSAYARSYGAVYEINYNRAGRSGPNHPEYLYRDPQEFCAPPSSLCQ
jgi:hypothetical protein